MVLYFTSTGRYLLIHLLWRRAVCLNTADHRISACILQTDKLSKTMLHTQTI